jgi:hypothetical protein
MRSSIAHLAKTMFLSRSLSPKSLFASEGPTPFSLKAIQMDAPISKTSSRGRSHRASAAACLSILSCHDFAANHLATSTLKGFSSAGASPRTGARSRHSRLSATR